LYVEQATVGSFGLVHQLGETAKTALDAKVGRADYEICEGGYFESDG
jgi:hypothetical protein